MGAEGVEDTLGTFLRSQGKSRFDLVCVFSVTMWVHLNHGDEGLRSFLSLLCRLGRYLLLEPQPWKCYQTASRRMRRLGKEEFPLLPGLKGPRCGARDPGHLSEGGADAAHKVRADEVEQKTDSHEIQRYLTRDKSVSHGGKWTFFDIINRNLPKIMIYDSR